MGNQREIRQVAPRQGLGVVLRIRPGHTRDVIRLLGNIDEQGRFYTYFHAAGEPLEFPNLDGAAVALGPQLVDRVVIQSGGKMGCGYEAFVDRVRVLAAHVEDAHFFVGDEEEAIDEFRLSGGELRSRRVHEGSWRPVDAFIRSLDLGTAAEPGGERGDGDEDGLPKGRAISASAAAAVFPSSQEMRGLDTSRFSREVLAALSAEVRNARLAEMEAAAIAELAGAPTLDDFQARLYRLIEDDLVGRLGYSLGRWEYDGEVESWGGRSFMNPSLPDELLLRSEYPFGVRLSWGEFAFRPWDIEDAEPDARAAGGGGSSVP